MLHQFRWIIVSVFGIFLLAMGYVYDIHPKLTQITLLNQQEKNLQQHFAAKKSQPSFAQSNKAIKHEPDNNKLTNISELIALIHASGLSIQNIKQSSSLQMAAAEKYLIHLVLRGEYQQLSALVDKLEQQSHALSLQNFIFNGSEKDNLLVAMDIMSFGRMRNTQSNSKIGNQQNPFCTRNHINKWFEQDEVNAALSAPLERIKMVGYLQQGTHRQALVLLPNAVMRTVEPGFLLGSERGVVVAVLRNGTQVKLADGRVMTLQLQNN